MRQATHNCRSNLLGVGRPKIVVPFCRSIYLDCPKAEQMYLEQRDKNKVMPTQTLPKIPVPPLSSTFGTEDVNKDVQESQKKIENLSNTRLDGWLHQLWNESAYLAYREPLPVNSNFATIIENSTLGRTMVQSAAQTIVATLMYHQAVPTNNILGAYRQPFTVVDRIYRETNSRHIVVSLKGNYYALEVLEQSGQRVPKQVIESQLQDIVESSIECFPVTLFTTMHRDTWVDTYNQLWSTGFENRESISKIESALFTVVLDDTLGAGDNKMKRSLCNPNIWYDKVLNWCIYKDGTVGLNGEHAAMDGVVIYELLDFVTRKITTVNPLLDSLEKARPQQLGQCQQLKWELSPQLSTTLKKAQSDFDVLTKRHSSVSKTSGQFGSAQLKALKVSADAIFQLAAQLTYHDLHGAFADVYESVTTSAFLNGRTENGLPRTPEIESAISALRGNGEEIVEKIHKASTAHRHKMKAASKGLGKDRHLLGLQFMSDKILDIPKVGPYQLITSHMGHEHFLFDCGTPSENAYGVIYKIYPSEIRWNTSMNTNSSLDFDISKFNTRLCENLNEIYGHLCG